MTALSVAVVGCDEAPEPEEPQEVIARGPFDPDDARTVVELELVLEEGADLGALAAQEMRYEGPFTDPEGTRFVVVRTTAAHAVSFVSSGLRARPRLIWGRRRRERGGSDAIVGTEQAAPSSPSCTWPPPGGLPPGTSFVDYPELKAEMQAMAGTSGVEYGVVGSSPDKESGETEEIGGLQFGPLDKVYQPPTLLLLGTYHAQEWLSMAVTMELARRLTKVVDGGGTEEPEIYAALQHSAVVVVPVVNAAGYTYSFNKERAWRKNRGATGCAGVYGVDLNRNHTVGWDPPVGASSYPACGANTYRGPSAASEEETQAIEKLLRGEAFTALGQDLGGLRPKVLLSYHTYGDLLIYPDAHVPEGDPRGPRCLLSPDHCMPPDFALLRDLLGDTHSKLFRDPTAGDAPYYRDRGLEIVYGASGDVTGHAMHQHEVGGEPLLAATPELPQDQWGFFVECEPDAESIVQQVADEQMAVLRRLVPALARLDTDDEARAWAPGRPLGTLAGGYFLREANGAHPYNDPTDPSTWEVLQLPELQVFQWRPHVDSRLWAGVAGDTLEFKWLRRGVRFDGWVLPKWPWSESDPLCLPCEVRVSSKQDDAWLRAGPEACGGCLQLCDDRRLPHGGFELVTTTRSDGVKDCYWRPVASGAWLEVPAWPDPGGSLGTARTCALQMTMWWEDNVFDRPVWKLFRYEPGGGMRELRRSPSTAPYPRNMPRDVDHRLLHFVFEANAELPGAAQGFRIEVDQAGELRIYDPVVTCWVEAP